MIGDPKSGQKLLHALVAFVAARLESEADVLPHGEVREQRRVLKDDPDPALLGGEAGEVSPGELHAASAGERNPAIASSSVVLPAPEGPSTTSTCPPLTCRSTGSRRNDPALVETPSSFSPALAAVTVNGPDAPSGCECPEDEEGGQGDE